MVISKRSHFFEVYQHICKRFALFSFRNVPIRQALMLSG
jgi:hypothetical protein